MIIVRLWGGIGNQLFQYAYGYSVAKSNNCNLLLDTRFYEDRYINKNKRFTVQKPQILNLNLEHNELYSNTELKVPVTNFLQKKNINRIIRVPSNFNIPINNGYRYVKETRFTLNDKLENLNGKNIYLDGYWQCEQYFLEYREDLLKQFICHSTKVKALIKKNSISNSNSVAIHIRRGDYVNNKNIFSNLYLLSENYYIDSIRFIEKTIENPHFFIFTNDFEWAKEKLSFMKNVTFVNFDRTMTDLEEFQVMAACKHQIISNSTYSWWAGWLNNNPEKIVIAPERWFGNVNIIPSSWIKIPTNVL